VQRSVRDELTWVITHVYTKAMLGIFLYSYPQLAKMFCLAYYAYVFSSTKLVIRAEQDLPGTEWGRREGRGGVGKK
jgi:hypothetical protein